MAVYVNQVVALGPAANDGNGDTLRAGMDKLNDNWASFRQAVSWDASTFDADFVRNISTNGGKLEVLASSADFEVMTLFSQTPTSVIRQQFRNSDSTKNFELTAFFTGGSERFLIQGLGATLLEFHTDLGITTGGATGGSQGAGTINSKGMFDDGALLTCYVTQAALGLELDDDLWNGFAVDTVIKGEPELEVHDFIEREIIVEEIKIIEGVARLIKKPIKRKEYKYTEYPVIDEYGKPVMDLSHAEILDDRGKVVKETIYHPRIYKNPVMKTIPATPDKTISRQHEGYNKFKARLGGKYDPLDIDKFTQHWKDKGHLTSYPNRKNYDPLKGLSTGEWIQRGVETDEILAVFIDKLHSKNKEQEALIDDLRQRVEELENFKNT